MAKVLVSIISEQLIPNYHLNLLLKNEIDKHILITTSKMEELGYTLNFKKLLKRSVEVELVFLEDFGDFEKISKNLKSINTDNEFIVNITGGTKVISLAVFNYFSQLKSEIFYIAIGTNSCQKIYPVQETPILFNHKLKLVDYLTLYGFSIEKANELYKDINITDSLFESVKQKSYNSLSVSKIRDAFGENSSKINKDELNYLRGLWFEEYIYNLIKLRLKLEDNQIALNVKVRREISQKTNDNEFDVMFVKNNKLYVVECKSSIGEKKEHKKNLESYLYKLSAAVRDMGLQVIPILAVVGDVEKHKSIVKRAEILRTYIIDSNKFENNLLLDAFINLI